LFEVLNFLQEKKIKIAIASSSPEENIKKVLSRAKINIKYFDKIISGFDVQEPKPHPQIYRCACEKLGVLPVNAIAIEDSDIGVESAVNAGMRAIYVPDLKPLTVKIQQMAFKTLTSLDETIQYIYINLKNLFLNSFLLCTGSFISLLSTLSPSFSEVLISEKLYCKNGELAKGRFCSFVL
jgi:beta-phosphoglucomutase-like phosphatase (HAD superfamily)